MKVSTVREMHRLDERAITEYGVPDYTLMEDAGGAVYYAIRDRFGVPGRRFTVVSGPGNNGGDSFVAARKLNASGAGVRVFVFADVDRYRGPARKNYEVLSKSGVEITIGPEREQVTDALTWCDAVVDGLLGTGLTRPVEGRFREAIEWVNESGRPVLSIDIPSGVDGDTGHVRGAAIRADTTVTFGLPKRGNLLNAGGRLCGTLMVTHLSFPPALTASEEITVTTNPPAELPSAPPEGELPHDVLFIGGARGHRDAMEVAARVFLRIAGTTPQVTSASPDLDPLLDRDAPPDLVVAGLGEPAGPETQQLMSELTRRVPGPLLIAGDAAAAVLADPDSIRQRAAPMVIVADSLPGTTLRDDPVPVLQDLATELGATIVLDADDELIGRPDGAVRINIRRSPGSPPASPPGWRDILPGAIAAAYGLGLPLEEAVATGLFLRAVARDRDARDDGTARVSPSGAESLEVI